VNIQKSVDKEDFGRKGLFEADSADYLQSKAKFKQYGGPSF
jgi:hypothetical protein